MSETFTVERLEMADDEARFIVSPDGDVCMSALGTGLKTKLTPRQRRWFAMVLLAGDAADRDPKSAESQPAGDLMNGKAAGHG